MRTQPDEIGGVELDQNPISRSKKSVALVSQGIVFIASVPLKYMISDAPHLTDINSGIDAL